MTRLRFRRGGISSCRGSGPVGPDTMYWFIVDLKWLKNKAHAVGVSTEMVSIFCHTLARYFEIWEAVEKKDWNKVDFLLHARREPKTSIPGTVNIYGDRQIFFSGKFGHKTIEMFSSLRKDHTRSLVNAGVQMYREAVA